MDFWLLDEVFRGDGEHGCQEMLLIDRKCIELCWIEVFPWHQRKVRMVMLCVSTDQHVYQVRLQVAFSNQPVVIDTVMMTSSGFSYTKSIRLICCPCCTRSGGRCT